MKFEKGRSSFRLVIKSVEIVIMIKVLCWILLGFVKFYIYVGTIKELVNKACSKLRACVQYPATELNSEIKPYHACSQGESERFLTSISSYRNP